MRLKNIKLTYTNHTIVEVVYFLFIITIKLGGRTIATPESLPNRCHTKELKR